MSETTRDLGKQTQMNIGRVLRAHSKYQKNAHRIAVSALPRKRIGKFDERDARLFDRFRLSMRNRNPVANTRGGLSASRAYKSVTN